MLPSMQSLLALCSLGTVINAALIRKAPSVTGSVPSISGKSTGHANRTLAEPVIWTSSNSQGKPVIGTATVEVVVTDPTGNATVDEAVTGFLTNSAASTYGTYVTTLSVAPFASGTGSTRLPNHPTNRTRSPTSPTSLSVNNTSQDTGSTTHTRTKPTAPGAGTTTMGATTGITTGKATGKTTGTTTGITTGTSSGTTTTRGGTITGTTPGIMSNKGNGTQVTNSAASALNAISQPTIKTSTVTTGGSTQLVPIFQGGSVTAPITLSTPTMTITSNGPALSTSVASVSNQITSLYPALSSWASKPDPAAATSIINDITPLIGGIGGLIGNLPNGGGDGGGLFGTLIGGLGSIANGLGEIAGNLPNGVNAINSVMNSLEGVQSDTENLQNEQNKDSDSTSKTSPSQTSTQTTRTCTKTITGYDTYVTCSVITASASTAIPSTTCSTSTYTTTGCDVTTTASTTTVASDACPASAASSVSAYISSAFSAAATKVNGTMVPLMYALTDVADSNTTTTSIITASTTSLTTGSHNTTTTGATPSPTPSGGINTTATTTRPTTTSHSPSTTPAPTFNCYPFEDPDAGKSTAQCECDGMTGLYPTIASTSGQGSNYNMCGYTTTPTTANTTVKPFTATESDGVVLSCASSSYYNYAVNTNAECAGASSAISTVASIASAYSVSVASVASVASAAAASSSWAAAAATPSASCLLLSDDGWGDLAFKVEGINGWAGSDGSALAQQESGCGIFSGFEWHTDGQSTFDGKTRDTQYAFFGLTFVKAGCVERAIHSAGGPDGLQCRTPRSSSIEAVTAGQAAGAGALEGANIKSTANANSSSNSTTADYNEAAQRIASAQLTNLKAIAKGSWATGSATGAQPDPELVSSASAALPHLQAQASSLTASTAPPTIA